MNHPKVAEYQADPARDYSTLLSTAEGADQSTNLPDMYNVVLPESTIVLGDPAYFDAWLKHITQILRPFSLDKLLDITIPRPERNSIHAAKWQRLSMKVRTWLGHQMSNSLHKKIQEQGYRIELADEFILNVRIAFKNPGLDAIAKAIDPVLLVERSDFELVGEYIQAMWEHYNNNPLVHVHIKPCIILSRILTEVRPEMPQFVENQIRMLDAKGDSWTKLTPQDVNDTCTAILVHMEELNAARAAHDKKQSTDPFYFDSKWCAHTNMRSDDPFYTDSKRRKREVLTEASTKDPGASNSTKQKLAEKPDPDAWEAKFLSLLDKDGGNIR